MALQITKIHLRSITIIGAGAAVLAVFGYFLMKSDSRKKSKKKLTNKTTEEQSLYQTDLKNNNNNNNYNEAATSGGISMSSEINETEEINKLCDLYSKKTFNKLSKCPSPPPESILTKPYINHNKTSLSNDEAIVPISNEITSTSPPSLNKLNNNNNNNNNEVVNNKIEQTIIESNTSQENCINNQNTEKEKLINCNLDEYNRQNSDLETNNLMNTDQNQTQTTITTSTLNTCDDMQTTTTNDNEQVLSSSVKGIELINDKLSETSSDSGNGTSEIHIVQSQNEAENEYDDEDHGKECVRNINRRRSKTSPESNHSMSSDSNVNKDHNNNNNDQTTPNENNSESIPTTTTTTTTMPQSTSSMSISSTTHPETDIIVYEFHFPRKYCGKLIGRNGVHVDYIRNKAHVQIAVRNDPSVEDLQIVCLTGCISDVDQALDIISARFPYRHYPQISFKPITKPIVYRRNRVENNKVLVSANMYVQLPPLIPNKTYQIDVNVSAIVTPVHLFIQLPSQPTYHLLQRLDEDMLHLYSTSDKVIPNLSCPVEYGTICAAPTSYGWHRAMVTDYYVQKEAQPNYPYYTEELEMATVKFLDYGGYLNIPVNQLKQLRTDFMSLPFQAIEVLLDGIASVEGEEENGKDLISKLIKNNPLKAVVTGHAEENVPLVKLFLINNPQKLLINNELVAHGFAQKLN